MPNESLVLFKYDSYCFEPSADVGMLNVCISPGNVGIIVSEYYKNPYDDTFSYEVLVGDRIMFDVDGSTFTRMDENKC